MTRLVRLALLLTLLPILPSSPASAQEVDDVFGEVIDVRVVNIETVVTDRQGRRVSGLTPADFRLVVDGREVPIDYFSEVHEGRVLPPEGAATRPGITAPREPTVGSARHVNYLIFIDDFFSIGAHRDRVLEGLRRQLAGMGPDDRVAIVAFEGGSAERLLGWTDSREEIAAALDRASRRKARGLFRRAERSVFGGRGARQESYVRLVQEQLENLTVAVATAMRSAAPPTGRKVLLLMSGGWPYELDIYEDPAFRDTFRGSGSLNERFLGERAEFGRNLWSYGLGRSSYQLIADTANLLGYTIYPIDVPGIGAAGRSVEDDAPGAATPPLDGSAESIAEATLLFLARETGGKAMLNSNNVRALERAAEDTRSYYWLGFTADRRADNRRHDVRLEARDPALRVRSRRGFVDFSRGLEVSMMVEGALLFDTQRSGEDFDIHIGEPRRLERRKMEVPVELRIPVGDLTHLYHRGSYEARMSVTLAVKDRRDTLSAVRTFPFENRSPQLPAPGAVATYELDVELWREQHELVVMVQDLATGSVLSSSTRIEP